ncbi:MAG: metallophosphoesterase [Marinifilaceae bacterium]
MKKHIKFSLLLVAMLVVAVSLYFTCNCSQTCKTELETNVNRHVDGPFILRNVNGEMEYITSITDKDSISVERTLIDRSKQFLCKVDNENNDSFSVNFMDTLRVHPIRYAKAEKMFVMSDLHGSFNAMSSLLINNGVIDKDFNWTFGNGHLVMIGDITDRGINTIPCLWLFYHLEEQVKNQLHYLFGNHELMTIYGRGSYLNEKTQKAIVKITGEDTVNKAVKSLFSDKSELGSWIRKRNTIEIIGDILFVHAGISNELVNSKLSIEQINKVVRKYADVSSRDIPKTDTIANMLFGRNGPIWYRGLVMDYKDYYKKMTQEDFSKVLEHFGVKRIFIGHTEVDNISSDYKGGLLRINVSQPWEKDSDKAQALLIDGDNYSRVNGKGTILKNIN